MLKTSYHILGVMSGTSLDGIDLAECFFNISSRGDWTYTMGETATIPYDAAWKHMLSDAVHFSEGRLKTLDEQYTYHLSEVIKSFINERKIKDLDAICSHGHTVMHQPDKGITLQIGNLPSLSTIVEHTVVCDFRVQDVKMGGQGAPLVPIGDRLLFSDFDYCLNLGGFANISFEQDGERLAYDICPVNIVLNRLALELGQDYDDEGKIARSGKIDEEILRSLNALEYYLKAPPKSLGVEWVHENISPILNKPDVSIPNKFRTFTEHIAQQLSYQLSNDSKVLITGGGVYNSFLLERLLDIADLEVTVPDSKLLEFKEALVFGLLGVLKLRDEVNCLASVTGARADHASGNIFIP